MKQMGNEALTATQIQTISNQAELALESGRGERIDPLTASTHTDHWAENLYGYVRADVAIGDTEKAEAAVDYWLDRTTPDGRMPHMIIDTSSWRRRHIDRYVQKAEPLEDDEIKDDNLVSPFLGHPVLSSCALMVAEALPQEERKAYAERVIDKLIQLKRFQYTERDIFDDGIPVQIHPDEMLLRAGNVAGEALTRLPESTLTRLERGLRANRIMKKAASSFRRWQADDERNEAASSYDVSDFMPLDSAARIYTLWATTRSNEHMASKLKDSTNRKGAENGFMVQDAAITGMMLADNQALENLAVIADKTLPDDVSLQFVRTRDSAQAHWDSDANMFASRLPKTGELLVPQTGIESFFMLLGGTALGNESQINTMIQAAMKQGNKSRLLIPTLLSSSAVEAHKIDRGALSPRANLLLYDALLKLEDVEGAMHLRQKIGDSVLKAARASGKFSRQYDSQTGEAIGQNYWGPTAASALAISQDLHSR